MSPTDGTFIHVDASMNKLLKAFSLAKVKQRFVLLGNFVDTNFDLFWKHKFIFYEEEKKVFETFANTARWKNSIFFFLCTKYSNPIWKIVSTMARDLKHEFWLLETCFVIRLFNGMFQPQFTNKLWLSCLLLSNFNLYVDQTWKEIFMLLKSS